MLVALDATETTTRPKRARKRKTRAETNSSSSSSSSSSVDSGISSTMQDSKATVTTAPPPLNYRDVGLCLERLGCSQVLRRGRLYRCGDIERQSWDALGRPLTIINLRNHDNDKFLEKHGVVYHKVGKAKEHDCFDVKDKHVRAWLAQVLSILGDSKTQYPVLVHCRSGKDRTGIVIACVLKILGVDDDVVKKEFLESKKANGTMLDAALGAMRKELQKTSGTKRGVWCTCSVCVSAK